MKNGPRPDNRRTRCLPPGGTSHGPALPGSAHPSTVTIRDYATEPAEPEPDDPARAEVDLREKNDSPQRRGIHRIVLEHRLLLRIFQGVLEDVYHHI